MTTLKKSLIGGVKVHLVKKEEIKKTEINNTRREAVFYSFSRVFLFFFWNFKFLGLLIFRFQTVKTSDLPLIDNFLRFPFRARQRAMFHKLHLDCKVQYAL